MPAFTPKRGAAPTSLESLLMSVRLVAPEGLAEAHQLMVDSDVNLGTAVMFLGLASAEQLASLIEQRTGTPRADVSRIVVSVGVKNLLPAEMAKANQVFPLSVIEESGQRILWLATTDPLDLPTISRIEAHCRMAVQPAFIGLTELQALYQKHYRSGLLLYPPGNGPGERTMSRRLDAIGGKAAPAPATTGSGDSQTVDALISLLIDKGLITSRELEQKIARLKRR